MSNLDGLKKKIRKCLISASGNSSHLHLNRESLRAAKLHRQKEAVVAECFEGYNSEVKKEISLIFGRIQEAESFQTDINSQIQDIADKNVKFRDALEKINRKISSLETVIGYNESHT
jgi:hypothetical protein